MRDLIIDSVDNLKSCLELRELILGKIFSKNLTESDIIEIVDTIDDLSMEQIQKLGNNFRRFPLGCDLLETVVGPCSSSLSLNSIINNSILTDFIGFPIHICAYAIGDASENEGISPLEGFKKIVESVDVPIDLDHFGKYGPMRFPKEITHCYGECYNLGPPYKGCPKNRIHKRLIDKEKEYSHEFEEWIKLSSTLCINVVEEQGGEEHAASIDEMRTVAEYSKKYGKGLEGIFHIGDGYDDLITGLKACIDLDVDVFVIEGGPFNRGKDRLKNFAKAITAGRILVKGGVVGTNGAYEDECRVGIRSGLNVIITGYSGNHHGYMCGYSPKTAKRGNFNLPKIISIMREEIKRNNLGICISDKNLIKSVAKGCLFLETPKGDLIYPNKIGNFPIGDAHWVSIKNSKLKEKTVGITLNNLDSNGKIGLLGGRYIGWGIVKHLSPDEVYVSDRDKWVEYATCHILEKEGYNVYPSNGDDKKTIEKSDKTYITSFIPEIVIRLKNKYPKAEILI